MVKVGHNGPEETTYIKQGVGSRIQMITVNGRCGVGKEEGGRGKRGGVGVQSMGDMGKDICPNFLQPFIENNKFAKNVAPVSSIDI